MTLRLVHSRHERLTLREVGVEEGIEAGVESETGVGGGTETGLSEVKEAPLGSRVTIWDSMDSG